MAKKKATKKANRPKTYEKSNLKIVGSLEDVLKVSIASAKKSKKE